MRYFSMLSIVALFLITLTACDFASASKVLKHSTVWDVAYRPDGHTLAAAHGGLGGDYVVRLWDLDQATNKPVVLSGHTSYIKTVAFDPSGQMLATGSADGTVRLWDMQKPTAVPIILRGSPDTETFESVVFSPDGALLAAGGSSDRIVRLWDTQNLTATPTTLQGGDYSGTRLTFSTDGSILAASEAEAIRLWYMDDLNGPTTELQPNAGPIWALALSPDAQTLAIGGVDKTIEIWNRSELGPPPTILKLTGHSDTVRSLAFSPDGRLLASASVDKTVRLWDMQQQQATPTTLCCHKTSVHSVVFSPDGHTIASGGGDGEVRLWSVDAPSSSPTVLVTP